MKLRLRWKILILTVAPLLTLAFATLWIVNRSITRQVRTGIDEDLRRAGAVLENLLDARAHTLTVACRMTVEDPKFFSALAIPGSYRDPEIRATVAGVARDFNAITEADLFEVTDAGGHLVASVGRDLSTPTGRATAVRAALAGRETSGILVLPDGHYQIAATPVIAGGRLVGTLLLGARIGGELAERLRELTRSEVTFASIGAVTGSTLESPDDRAAVEAAVASIARRTNEARGGTLIELRSGPHRYVTLVRPLPRSAARQQQV